MLKSQGAPISMTSHCSANKMHVEPALHVLEGTHLSTSPVCPANSFTAALDSTSHSPQWQSALAVSSWGGRGRGRGRGRSCWDLAGNAPAAL